MSLLLLGVGSAVVWSTWSENTGDASVDMSDNMATAVAHLRADRKVVYLGLIQSLFEGAMYIFVFMWTPALEAGAPFGHGIILHGWIFACFMVGR